MTTYVGNAPFDNLTPKQIASIDAASRSMEDASWRPGFWRFVRSQLAGDGPWLDGEIAAAIEATFDNFDITYL